MGLRKGKSQERERGEDWEKKTNVGFKSLISSVS